MIKLLEEAEKTVSEMEQMASEDRIESLDGVVIPTIYDNLQKLESYDVKRKILEAVVSPEMGGVVKMTYDDIRHWAVLDAKLNYHRTVNIIKALRNGTLADGSFFNPDYSRQRP